MQRWTTLRSPVAKLDRTRCNPQSCSGTLTTEAVRFDGVSAAFAAREGGRVASLDYRVDTWQRLVVDCHWKPNTAVDRIVATLRQALIKRA